MNSTLQVLRTIPELHNALGSYAPSSQSSPDSRLTTEMHRLYHSMGKTTERMIPALFLQSLRTVAPQFAEQRPGQGYAQQGSPLILYLVNSFLLICELDAEECLGSILNSLRQSSLTVPDGTGPPKSLVEKYLMGEMTTEYGFVYSPVSGLNSI